MSITYTNAKLFVTRVLGNEGDSAQQTVAEDTIKAAIQEWNIRHDWSFLLMDTSNGFSVASSTIAVDGITVTTSVANGFAGVNVGQAVSGTGVPVGTTVLSITSTTVIVLSAASTPASVTLTFGADIPVIVGTDTYNLPSPTKRAYSARLLTNERSLQFKEQREIDRGFTYQDQTSTPLFYNIFNDATFTVGRQNGKVRLFPIPSITDTLRVRYYRPIAEPSAGSDNLDVPDRYVYALLELARYYYLKDHDAETTRLGETKERAEMLLVRAMADDEQGSEDRDYALIPLIEHAQTRMLDSDDINWGSL